MLKPGGPMPKVVLADTAGKNRQIRDFPFSAAYEAFKRSLRRSSHWLIIGYSFRDEGINDPLAEGMRWHLAKYRFPRVLVVDHRSESVEQEDSGGVEESQIADAIGGSVAPSPDQWLTINDKGAFGFLGQSEWDKSSEGLRGQQRWVTPTTCRWRGR